VQNILVCANAVGGNFLISRDVLGKWLVEKNRRWGKFLEITANSAPLLCTEQRCLNKKQEINFQVNKIF